MHVNNIELTPPKELLARCHTVLIPDPKTPPFKMKKWALEHCQSYVWMDEVDVYDVSYEFDAIYGFYFGTEADKIMFALKWK